MNKIEDINKEIKIRDAYIEEIHPNIWLMNNHKWAYYVWEKYKSIHESNSRFSLIHLDKHWDGINDFQDDSRLLMLKSIDSINGIEEIVDQGDLIKDASFIAPGIIRNLLSEIHFYCLQDDTEEGIDDSLLNDFNCTQFKYNDIDSLINYKYEEDILFDLDLDLFNKDDYWMKGDLWKENEIADFVNKCSGIIANSSLVTIAISPGYSGTKDDMIFLKELVVPKIVTYFSE